MQKTTPNNKSLTVDNRCNGSMYSLGLVVIVVLLVLPLGCGGNEVKRHNLSGKVTYRGEPVHNGMILFEPDGTKGNRGPQGYSSIVDGLYSTGDTGKGAMVGPIKVTIFGFKEGSSSEEGARAALFPEYETAVEITPKTTTLDFEVPDSQGSTGANR